MLNPPMVHQVVGADSVTEQRPWVRLAAAALGDGSIMLFDGDADGGGSGKGGGGKGGKVAAGKGGGKAGGAGAEAGAVRAEDMVPGWGVRLDSEVGCHSAPASCVCFIPGLHRLAGAGDGGDAVRAGGAAGGGGGGGGELLLASGGEDRHVLIWSVQRALALTAHHRQPRRRGPAREGDDGSAALAAAEGQGQGGQGRAQQDGAGGEGEGKDDLSWEADEAAPVPLVHREKHRRKLNGMCTLGGGPGVGQGQPLVVVADTSRLLTCYRLQPERFSTSGP